MTKFYSICLFSVAMLAGGCGQSSNTHLTVRPAEGTSNGELHAISTLLDQYQNMPELERHSLQGDQIIMQIDALLRARPGDPPSRAANAVAEHNRKMLQRALNDPDLIEITGTEMAPTPRER